uniref:Uncharacterized protein n=1 Tax=Coccidioides posadasii RMSCC 3488 TaxID=454284 RepID=A0A0J6FBM8_COCPO|nr:hypothetical protein CPAG_06753 [Coccidioides posadasii RMSCC 3488]
MSPESKTHQCHMNCSRHLPRDGPDPCRREGRQSLKRSQVREGPFSINFVDESSRSNIRPQLRVQTDCLGSLSVAPTVFLAAKDGKRVETRELPSAGLSPPGLLKLRPSRGLMEVRN